MKELGLEREDTTYTYFSSFLSFLEISFIVLYDCRFIAEHIIKFVVIDSDFLIILFQFLASKLSFAIILY